MSDGASTMERRRSADTAGTCRDGRACVARLDAPSASDFPARQADIKVRGRQRYWDRAAHVPRLRVAAAQQISAAPLAPASGLATPQTDHDLHAIDRHPLGYRWQTAYRQVASRDIDDLSVLLAE